MLTVKGPGNKAPVEILTHPQKQLRYGASNWANNAMFSCYCIVISAKLMSPCFENTTVKKCLNICMVKGQSKGLVIMTANLHCYTNCTLTTLHCSKVSFLQSCHMKIYNKIFIKMRGVYSLLAHSV